MTRRSKEPLRPYEYCAWHGCQARREVRSRYCAGHTPQVAAPQVARRCPCGEPAQYRVVLRSGVSSEQCGACAILLDARGALAERGGAVRL